MDPKPSDLRGSFSSVLVVFFIMAFFILFGIIISKRNKRIRNRPSRPVQEYTNQQNREFVVKCNEYHLFNRNRHILVTHHQPQRNEIHLSYIKEAISENQKHIKNSLFVSGRSNTMLEI